MSHVISFEQLAEKLLSPSHPKEQTRLIGIDLGTKTIGLALSDVERKIASSLKIIQRKKFSLDAADLMETAAKFGVAGFVIGLPLNMDGSEGPRVQSTRAFIRSMTNLTDLPFLMWDERLSTVAAERMLIEADLSRAKRKAVVDSTAAAFILQGALDRLHHLRRFAI
jgi:putative holliday junction resolvase